MAGIRPYRPSDRDAVYRVCVMTGEDGGDATGLYPDDLIPDVYAGPYLDFDPGLAFVLDTGSGAVGYVIATADTRAFVRRYRSEWLPGFEKKYPMPEPETVPERVAAMIQSGYQPERMLLPEVDEYPAHLHIDILPGHQGAGWGRALMDTLLDALAERGVGAVHLTMSPTNTAARAFYDRYGFAELPSSRPNAPALGIRTPSSNRSAETPTPTV
jgi:ribosomal protein S18 acetylase RimI-like enzyme